MSVNITVNGKFAKHSRYHPLLEDPQEVKKAEEKERRKLRLLQVREESKKLAKKIREEVNEEKKRELEKLQAIKERELECWRQHALKLKDGEYRAAIFQVGTAHEAAKRENEKHSKQKSSYKDFQKQNTIGAKKSTTGSVKFKCKSSCPCQQSFHSANKHFECTCNQTDKKSSNNKNEAHKRKRNVSLSTSESESEGEGFKEQTTVPQSTISLSSTSDSTTSFNNNEITESSIYMPTKNKWTAKNPALHLDVELGTDDSVTINAPPEGSEKVAKSSVLSTKNKYFQKKPAVFVDLEVGSDDSIIISAPGEPVENNRELNSIIRISPRKGRKLKENTYKNPTVQLSSTCVNSSDVTTSQQYENKSSFESQNNQISKSKRFTVISDLVKKQQSIEAKGVTSDHDPSCPPNSQSSAMVSPLLSPRKQAKEVPVLPPVLKSSLQSPRKISATSKSSKSTTSEPTTSVRGTSKPNTLGRVQFYDYNSKFAKEQDQAATKARAEREKDHSQPTAMEQAVKENQKEKEKQLETLKMSEIIDERGQKALEREQIRRDCNELTEKLEILTREYPNQLPTNENQLHIFADKQLRKECKMNTAIEKLLQRPNVITFSEQNKPIRYENKLKPSTNMEDLSNLLNVASLNNKVLDINDASSDSCRSILLGYVDDQSKLIKQDLQSKNSNRNESKQIRLKNLLKRLDQLRNSLLEELRNERSNIQNENCEKQKSKFALKEQNLKEVIDNISEMRKEHEELLIEDQIQKSKALSAREKELKAKEQILDKKVREFYELQKRKNLLKPTDEKNLKKPICTEQKEKDDDDDDDNSNSNDLNIDDNDKENKICATGDNPLEIIITVRGETKCVKKLQKPKRRVRIDKRPSILSTLIKSPQLPSIPKKLTPKKKTQAKKALCEENILRKQNSYDSNSTSYVSLPPELSTKIDESNFDQSNKSNKESEIDTQLTLTHNEQPEYEILMESSNNVTRFNQQHKINPLVAQYVQKLLGMTRNAVEKLGESSSDIETPSSSIINITSNVTERDANISDERLRSLHHIIQENKSFIKDLEESIKSKNNISLENSIRIIDEMWRKLLKGKNMDNVVNSKRTQKMKGDQQTDKISKNIIKDDHKSLLESKKKNASKNNKESQIVERLPNNNNNNNNKQLEKKAISSTVNGPNEQKSTTALKMPKRCVEKVDKAIDAKLLVDSVKDDTQIARYAELTENCTHRIAELTDLINRVREEKQRLLEVTLSSISDNGRPSGEHLEKTEGKSNTHNEPDDITRVSSSSEEACTNKQSYNSLQEMPKLSPTDKNKQIANSRDSGIAESRPATAQDIRVEQESTSESTMIQIVRKPKPPPTLNRFSPQLPEDDLAHELSTIFEVDTPATSRINTAVAQPVKYPSFEQYVKEIGLDINQLDPEQSAQLQQEFTSFMECLQQSQIHEVDGDLHASDTMEECLAKLTIIGKNYRMFPSLRQYVESNQSKPSDGQQLLDTQSLENITDGPTCTNTENDSDILDIEKELKKRRILKRSFRIINGDNSVTESGVDKLSSDNTSDLLDIDVKQIVKHWKDDLKTKSKTTKTLISTSTSTNPSDLAKSALRAASVDVSSKGHGQMFNLRDFLTRELEKLANSGSTINSSSDESLRSHFLNSLIESITPRTVGTASKSGVQTLDRQRTSTPVAMKSPQANTGSQPSSNRSQLFSGESHISSVHYKDRSVRFASSEDGNADQSSN